MKDDLKHLVTVLVRLASHSLLLAAEPTLKIGDPAPKLQVGKWVQGEPVKEFKAGTAYIVEFWATWCGPCRVSIPHLNELHQKFKDKGLVVIGQDCWEKDESLVAPFIQKMSDKMTYRVALDDKQGSKAGQMAETWMAAAGQGGIPTAFVVDTKGVIAWIGHPMSLDEKLIEQVLAGTFDSRKAAEALERERKAAMASRQAASKLQAARALRDQGKLAEAEIRYREELAAGQKRWTNDLSKVQPSAIELAEVLQRQGKYPEMKRLFDELLPPNRPATTEQIGLLQWRAEFLARHARWADAASDYTRLAALDPAETFYPKRLARLLVQTGDLARQEEICRQMLARFGSTEDDAQAEATAKTCLLRPLSGATLKAAASLAEKAAAKGPDNIAAQLAGALASYRLGEFEASAGRLDDFFKLPPNLRLSAQAYAVLAMAQHRQGKTTEAAAALAKARDITESKLPQPGTENLGGEWYNILGAHILLREAQNLIGGASSEAVAPALAGTKTNADWAVALTGWTNQARATARASSSGSPKTGPARQ
jgi:thiol-disulfide isomerase/thioredoxin